MTLCTSCYLSSELPYVRIGKDGKCNFCNAYEKKWKNKDYEASEKKLMKIFEEAKKNTTGKYDCIIPVSGGKDSSYVLYLCKEKYKLNPLAVNYDNGFQSEEARENINSLCEELGVDVRFTGNSWKLLKKVYSTLLKKTGEFCNACNLGIFASVYRVAKKENIPLIILGYSNKIETTPIYENKRYCGEKLLIKTLQPEVSKEELKPFLMRHMTESGFFNPICLPDYIDWNENKIINTLKSIGWKGSDNRIEHVDCLAYPITRYLKAIKHKCLKSTYVAAAMYRDNQISKEKLFEVFEKDKNIKVPENFEWFLKKLGLKMEDIPLNGKSRFEFVSKKPFKAPSSLKGSLEERVRILTKLLSQDLETDGGSIDSIRLENDVLYVKIGGPCKSCYLKHVTLQRFIEQTIVDNIPEIREVIIE